MLITSDNWDCYGAYLTLGCNSGVLSWRPWSMCRLTLINCLCCSVHCCCDFEGLAPPMPNPSYPAVSALHALDQKEQCWVLSYGRFSCKFSLIKRSLWKAMKVWIRCHWSGLLPRLHTCQRLYHPLPSNSWISWNCVRSLLPADDLIISYRIFPISDGPAA